MTWSLSAAEAETFRRILDGVAARSCVGTAVVRQDVGPDVFYKDGFVWYHWAHKFPLEDVTGWTVWSIRQGRWFPYRPKVAPIVELPRPGD